MQLNDGSTLKQIPSRYNAHHHFSIFNIWVYLLDFYELATNCPSRDILCGPRHLSYGWWQ